MILTKAKLLNYRNLSRLELDVSARINIFLGRNGQGKTNLLEGLAYLALGRSHRGSRDRELIQFGGDHLHVSVEGQDASGDRFRLEAAVTEEGRKRIKVDGNPIQRNADLVGHLTTVLFNPDEVELAKGGPEHRRRFLDYTLSLTSSEYFRHLLAYRRALAQKNSLLKERSASVGAELDVWDEELVRFGAPLQAQRWGVLEALERLSAQAYSALAPGAGTLRMSLQSSVGAVSDAGEDTADEVALATRLREALAAARGRELMLGHSRVGPHRDRLELSLDDKDLRRFGSQGEMRSAAIALKLGQAELIYERTHDRPVVFLDDIFSELDRGRAEALQRWLSDRHQLFIASARADDVENMSGWDGVKVWIVEDGRVRALEDPTELTEFGSIGHAGQDEARDPSIGEGES